MYPCIDWNKARLDEAQREIERTGGVRAAAEKLTARWGRKVTDSAIKNAFRAHGRESPGSYARKAFSSFRAVKIPDSGIGNARLENPLCHPFPESVSPQPEPPPRPTSGLRRILVCPDLHAPYHDQAAWQLFLNVAEVLRPDILVIIGDFFDCYAVSSFTKDPERVRFLRDELEEGKAAVQQVAALRVPRVVYCEGNHEFRIPRFVASSAPELHGFVHLPSELNLAELGWEWVPYREHIQIGKMAFAHDMDRTGVYAARWTLHDFGGNITFGHTHRGCDWYESTLHEGPRVCNNVGWLGDVSRVDYKHQAKARRESQLGFGLEYQEPDGITHAHFVPIVNGRCEVEGRVVS